MADIIGVECMFDGVLEKDVFEDGVQIGCVLGECNDDVGLAQLSIFQINKPLNLTHRHGIRNIRWDKWGLCVLCV